MLLLAADTSARDGSIALARGEAGGRCRLIETAPLSGGAFSAQLVPQIAALLSNHGFSKNDIGGFTVVSGPGSFTGLRVGLAAIKALGEVWAKPIAAVSLLEVVAVTGALQGRVLAALDAGRQQIYVGDYDVTPGNSRRIKECLLTRDEFASLVRDSRLVTPDPPIAALARAVQAEVQLVAAPRLDTIAELGWRKIVAGETVSPENLDAIYINRPNAEIFVKRGS
jgi:tRNA threonylcarbamoyladenosine biosynthesis protein TsaB